MRPDPNTQDTRDTDLTQPGRTPRHDDGQPGQTGAPGRDVAPQSDDATTGDAPDDDASPGKSA